MAKTIKRKNINNSVNMTISKANAHNAMTPNNAFMIGIGTEENPEFLYPEELEPAIVKASIEESRKKQSEKIASTFRDRSLIGHIGAGLDQNLGDKSLQNIAALSIGVPLVATNPAIAPITNSIKHTGKVLLDPTKAITGFGQAAATTADVYGTIQGLRQIPGAINNIKQGNGTAMDYFDLVTGAIGPFGTFNTIKGIKNVNNIYDNINLFKKSHPNTINYEEKLEPKIITYTPKGDSEIPTIHFRKVDRILKQKINTPEIINLPQLSKTSTRELIKDFNIKFAKRYGYEPISLDLEFDEAKEAIQKLGETHNTFLRGVSDYKNSALTDAQKQWFDEQLLKHGFDPNIREDRLKYAAQFNTPSTGYGRADSPQYKLSTLTKDGKLIDRYGYSYSPYQNYIPQGTSYASNSYGLAKGYTYGDGMVAVVRRPFELSENPYNWKTDIDFILKSERYKGNNNSNNFDNLLYEYVTGRNLNSDIDKESNIGKLYYERNKKLNDFLNKSVDDYLNFDLHLLDYFTPTNELQKLKSDIIRGNYILTPAFVAPNGKNYLDLHEDINNILSKSKYKYRANSPKTIKDLIYQTELYNQLKNNKDLKNLNYAFESAKNRLKVLQEIQKLPVKFDRSAIKDALFRKYLADADGKWLPEFHEFYDKIKADKPIFTNLFGKYYPKSKNPDTRHYINIGDIDEKAWDFIEEYMDPAFNGTVTRQHYNLDYVPFVTRKTKKIGGIDNNVKGNNLKVKYGGMKENKVFKLKGGVAIPLDDKKKLFYLSGAKHEQGGIDVTPELEAEGGEVVKVNPKSIKVVTAQKIMGGKSPAELVVDASSTGKSDAVFNKVFNYQEEFKDRVGLNDDGTRKAKFGKFINGIKNKVKAFMGSDYKFNKIYNNGDEVYKELNNIVSSATSDKDLETKLNNFWDSIKDNASIGYDTFKGIKQDIEHYKKYPYSSIVLTRDRVDYDKKEEFNRKHSIPVDQNKIVTLRNAGKSNNTTLSTNLLDSLAYRAGRVKADTVRMLGIPAQETGLGKFEGTTYMSPASIRINDINYPLYRGEYAEKFMRDGEVTPSELMNNHNYYTNTADQEAIGAISRKHNVGHDASKGYVNAVIDYNEVNDDVEKSFKETFNYTTNKRKKENINIHPLEDAYRLDKLGIYNTGLPNHNELVEARGRELWQSPEIKQWWNTSGKSFYEKGKSEIKRLGGNMEKKRVFGLEDVNLENKTKYTDAYLKNKELFKNRVIQQNPTTTLAPKRKFDVTGDDFGTTGNKLTGYDWANIGVNALGSLLTFGHALGNAKVNPLKYSDLVPYTGAKLKTRVNINSAKQKIKRATDRINDSINKNTSNSTVALNRLRNTYLNERDALVDLYTNKENTENQLINKDILNQQSARFKTISDYNTVRRENEKNRYLAERETQENINDAISGFVQNIGNTTSSIANTLERRDQFDKNMKILGLAYPNLDVERLNKVIRPTNTKKSERDRKREKIRLIRKGIIKPSEI